MSTNLSLNLVVLHKKPVAHLCSIGRCVNVTGPTVKNYDTYVTGVLCQDGNSLCIYTYLVLIRFPYVKL